MKTRTTKKPATKKTKRSAKVASPKAAKAVTEKPAAPKHAANNSQFAGKKLYATTKTNPRREGSHGHRSLALIIAKPGIGYEQFLAAGGRNRDLRYDVAKKHVEARG